MKKSRIIAPALGVLILSTAASITGTVAWFTANNSVDVKGMTVKTTVSSNLYIGADTLDSTTNLTDADLIGGTLTQSVSKILLPVSSDDGVNFYYNKTNNADGHIDVADDAFIDYSVAGTGDASDTTTYGNKFSENYGLSKTDAGAALTGETFALGYVDYVFQLKAVNTTSAAIDLKLTTLSLTYSGAKDTSTAYRVAMFYENILENASDHPAGGVGTLAGICATGAATSLNQDPAGKAVSSTSEKGTVTYNASAAYTIASVARNTTAQYKVVVRLWLEGEDKTCTTNTFATLDGNWSLKLGYHFDSSTAAATTLKKYTSLLSETDSQKYVCDGTNVFLADAEWNPTGDAVTSTGLNNATLETELETKFGVTIS